MGNRALIHMHDGKDAGPCIYLHWGGGSVQSLINATRETMKGREGDVAYSTARFLAHACNETPGNLSIGCWNGPAESYDELHAAAQKPEYSHGDAGVFLVDCRDWSVECFGGYGLTDPAAD